MNCANNFITTLLLIILSVILSRQFKTNYINHNLAGELKESKSRSCSSDRTCPTWFTCNSQTGNCQCENRDDGAIICDNEKHLSQALNCYCVTYDNASGYTHVGLCLYTCYLHGEDKEIELFYYKLPQKTDLLINSSACTLFHRTGLLCGDCEPGYSPLVLSYNLSCVECPDGDKNWWRFIFAGFVPLTGFYFLVIFFSINVTSSQLHGVVWFCQSISTPAFSRAMLLGLRMEKNPLQLNVVKAFCVFFSVWNLDLFYTIIPDICLNISTLQALALQYLPALYPYVLILLSYFIIKLYDRNFKVVVIAWSPFKKLRSLFRMSLDVRTSVIDSFVTFFYLSYIKILSVSADLLIPTKIYQLGSNKTVLGLYYSPTVEYFGDSHLPYAILAIVILAVFVFIPTVIIILYPFRIFQKFISLFPFNWHFLHAFVDSFQGSYNDGTEHIRTMDSRWFSVIILLLRIVLFIIFGLAPHSMFYIYGIITVVILLMTMINIEPFKKSAVKYFSTNLIFFFLFILCYIALVGRAISGIDTDSSTHHVLAVLALLSAFIPLLYMIYLIGSWFISKRKRRTH